MENQQSTNTVGRRKFIYDASLASFSTLFISTMLGGCESIDNVIRNRPVRRMIQNNIASNAQVNLYRTAVQAMKNLPVSDCRSWIKQASIHQNYCPHGNWFFFPWHRAYLFAFEKICQKLLNDNSFALPYWNWSINGNLPAPYWPPPTSNPLYNSSRLCTSSSIANSQVVGINNINLLLNEPNFTLFAGGITPVLRPQLPQPMGSLGQIEQTAHNYIHNFVGGNMLTALSPLDPIFWNHHCMVDLCWYEHNIVRNFPNTNNPSWGNFSLAGMFCDGDGNMMNNITVGTTILMPLLSYRYETNVNGQIPPVMQYTDNASEFKKAQEIIKKGSKVELTIRKKYELKRGIVFGPQKVASETLSVDSVDFIESMNVQNKERVIIAIKNLVNPPKTDVFVRVFINKIDANPETSTDDLHYAGSFFFFTHGGDHTHGDNHKAPDYLVDITETLKKIKATKTNIEMNNITINLVAVPIEGLKTETTTLTAENIELLICLVNTERMNLK